MRDTWLPANHNCARNSSTSGVSSALQPRPVPPQLEAGHFAMVVLLPSQPVMIEADPMRITLVLINLLDNAAKLSEPYGMIGIGIEDASRVVTLRVVDRRIGIPADVLPRIFDRFAQADSART